MSAQFMFANHMHASNLLRWSKTCLGISRVNHVLTHIAPAPPLLVTYDRWSRSFHQKGQNSVAVCLIEAIT